MNKRRVSWSRLAWHKVIHYLKNINNKKVAGMAQMVGNLELKAKEATEVKVNFFSFVGTEH
jgi:hypothetical protein